MFPSKFSNIQLYKKKRDSSLYQASNGIRRYFFKIIPTKNPKVLEAIRDEYETFSRLSHPGIPIYYGLEEHFSYPNIANDCIALCISDCTPKNPLFLHHLTEELIIYILIETGKILSWLLEHGVLYMDLNPSNLLVDLSGEKPEVTLIDFTYCYYFIKNPNPSYDFRFSYDLDPTLKGQQLLIQELTLLLRELISASPNQVFSDALFAVMQTGLHPDSNLSLEQYLLCLKKLLV